MTNDDSNSSFSSPPEDEEIETTFRRLRREGHSRMEAVQVILEELDLSLSEAKEVLLTSDTWAEAQAETDDVTEPPSTDAPPPAPG